MNSDTSYPDSGQAHPAPERLIFALDVTRRRTRALVETLGDAVSFYKIGLQLFMAGGYYELIEWLASAGKRCSST